MYFLLVIKKYLSVVLPNVNRVDDFWQVQPPLKTWTADWMWFSVSPVYWEVDQLSCMITDPQDSRRDSPILVYEEIHPIPSLIHWFNELTFSSIYHSSPPHLSCSNPYTTSVFSFLTLPFGLSLALLVFLIFACQSLCFFLQLHIPLYLTEGRFSGFFFFYTW